MCGSSGLLIQQDHPELLGEAQEALLSSATVVNTEVQIVEPTANRHGFCCILYAHADKVAGKHLYCIGRSEEGDDTSQSMPVLVEGFTGKTIVSVASGNFFTRTLPTSPRFREFMYCSGCYRHRRAIFMGMRYVFA